MLRNLGSGMLGKKHTEETKAKMRATAMKTLDQRIANLSKGWGHPVSDETKKKISMGNRGRVSSQEERERRSKFAKERFKNPANHPAWRGGRRNHSGYVQIKMPNHPRAIHGYAFEHIVVWERVHGRPVPSDMSIHHLNGIRSDNRPENLVAIRKDEHVHRGMAYYERIRTLEAENASLKMLLEKHGVGWPERIQEFPKEAHLK